MLKQMKLLRWLKWAAVLLIIGSIYLVIAAPFYIHSRFNTQHPIARLQFVRLGEQHYIAELQTPTRHRGDFCQSENYPIWGDQWQLDASFLRWKGVAVMLGFESRYRLDRLSGRYHSVERQNARGKLVHSLSPKLWLNLFDGLNLDPENIDGQSSILVDTVFGSSVYLNIDTKKVYTVFQTEDGLIAKAQAKPIETVDLGITTITIDKACAKQSGFVELLARRFNGLAVKYL